MEKKETIRNIEAGNFYLIFDGSKTGHPGLVISKDDDANRYLVIITESDKFGNYSKREMDKRHLTDLSHQTEDGVAKSYVKNRPMLCKRKDIGRKELIGMSIHKDDQIIIENISKAKPTKSPSLRRQKNNR